MNKSCVVLSIKGWDGTTIMGTYLSVEEAKLAGYSYIMSNGKNTDMFSEEIILDITENSSLAKSKEITTLQEDKITVTTKRHCYT
jgi:hypothetical protein